MSPQATAKMNIKCPITPDSLYSLAPNVPHSWPVDRVHQKGLVCSLFFASYTVSLDSFWLPLLACLFFCVFPSVASGCCTNAVIPTTLSLCVSCNRTAVQRCCNVSISTCVSRTSTCTDVQFYWKPSLLQLGWQLIGKHFLFASRYGTSVLHTIGRCFATFSR